MSVMALGFAVSFSSCKKDELKTRFEVNENEVTVAAAGGAAQVAYSLENPIDGVQIIVEPESGVSWINNIDLTTAGVIKFNVDANSEKDARQAQVNVKYDKFSDSFVVKQSGTDDNPDGEASFVIDVPADKVTETSVFFSVTPSDKEMTYITMLVEKSYFDEFATPEEYIQDDIQYFQDYADMYQMSLEEYLSGYVLNKGDVPLSEVPDCTPNTDYIVYAYGLSAQAEVLTDFFYEQVRTKAVEKIDMTFELDYAVDGPVVTASVKPSDDENWYIFNVIEKSQYTDNDALVSSFQTAISQELAFAEMLGMSKEDYIKEIGAQGSKDFQLTLSATTDYIGFAIAINFSGLLISDPSTKEFTTGDVEPSDNIIDVKITNVGARTADVNITTTNDDPYVFGTDMAANWEGMSNEEILNELIANYSLDNMVHSGDYSVTLENYQPNTEYVTFTFGYVAGVATTELIKVEFKTLEAQASDVEFRLLHDKYFDGKEVAEAYPEQFGDAAEYAIMPTTVQLTPADKAVSCYYSILLGDVTDIQEYPDADIEAYLMQQGYQDENGYFTYFYMPFDTEATIVGFAIDNEGNYGPISREVVNLAKSGISPMSDFPEPDFAPAFMPKPLDFIRPSRPQNVMNIDVAQFGKATEKAVEFHGLKVDVSKVRTEKVMNNGRRLMPVR